MARRKGIKFVTEKQRSTNKMKRFILGFAAFLIVFAVISVVYVFRVYRIPLSELFSGEESTQTSESSTQTRAALNARATFLLAGASQERDELYFVMAVFADLPAGEVRVCSLDPSSLCSVQGEQDSLEGHFRRFSERGLAEAAGELCGFEIDRYAVSTPSQFKNAVNALNGAVVTVPERIDYKASDYSLSLMPGEQTVKGDTLLKYFRYCADSGAHGRSAQAQLLCELLNQYISGGYLASGREYFSSVIDALVSNITIVDFSRALSTLESMARAEPPVEYRAVNSPQELKAAG